MYKIGIGRIFSSYKSEPCRYRPFCLKVLRLVLPSLVGSLWISSWSIFQHYTDVVCYIMAQNGFTSLCNYKNDFIFFWPSIWNWYFIYISSRVWYQYKKLAPPIRSIRFSVLYYVLQSVWTILAFFSTESYTCSEIVLTLRKLLLHLNLGNALTGLTHS